MNILLVAATQIELADILEKFGKESFIFSGHRIVPLITGIGMVNLAYRVGKFFTKNKFDLAINFGVAGSFDPSLKLGEVVEVVEECYADLGILSESGFEGMRSMGFVNFYANDRAYYNTIRNPNPSSSSLRKVSGLTLNQVSGTQESIIELGKRWNNKQIETMESAAFFQVCLEENVPFYAFRAISNYVEPRNKHKWMLQEAIENGERFLLDFIEEL
jgi:futalosine hydrolase